jgi:hypothetical protein
MENKQTEGMDKGFERSDAFNLDVSPGTQADHIACLHTHKEYS